MSNSVGPWAMAKALIKFMTALTTPSHEDALLFDIDLYLGFFTERVFFATYFVTK